MVEDRTGGDDPMPDDLRFDVTKHTEGLEAMQRLGFDPRSIRAGLIARERAVFGSPGYGIQIRHDIPGAEAPDAVCEQIHAGADAAEGAIIRQDVERYFLRHFPGRTTAALACPASGAVYIVCTPPPPGD